MSETANAAPLRQLVERRWRECTESRDVLLINSRLSAVPEEGIPFLVRFLDTADLKMKKSNLKRSKSFVDPFGLAYRRGDGSGLVIKEQDGYALLFNKFSVMDHHMLLVPDVPYPQTDPLTLEDFKRVVCLMDSIPSLFFYNCGVQSGASQPHKHIQMIPLDSFDSSKLPVDDVIASRVPSASSELFTIPQFRFEHRIALLNSFNEPIKPLKAEDLYEKYIQLLRSFHLREEPTLETITDHLVDTNESYNFLVTPNYMILVPRLKDSFSSINVNSLGFIGSLVVTSDETDSLLRKEGPLKILKNVAIPRE